MRKVGPLGRLKASRPCNECPALNTASSGPFLFPADVRHGTQSPCLQRAVGIELGEPAFDPLLPEGPALSASLLELRRRRPRPLCFVFHPADRGATARELARALPEGKLEPVRSQTPGRDFLLFLVEASG